MLKYLIASVIGLYMTTAQAQSPITAAPPTNDQVLSIATDSFEPNVRWKAKCWRNAKGHKVCKKITIC